MKIKYSKKRENSKNSLKVDSSIINFVTSPMKTFFDPIGSVISENQVDDRLDEMFSVESLGICEEYSDYDKEQLQKFNDGVVFKQGKYHVKLPWNERISEVKSNFHVCKAVLERVAHNLRNRDLYQAYDEGIKELVDSGTIEQTSLSDVDNSVYIPHHPVIREDEQCTTKLRIVLNCA